MLICINKLTLKFWLKLDTAVPENVENDGFCLPLCQELPENGHGSGHEHNLHGRSRILSVKEA